MDFAGLATFVAVMRAGSFAAVARERRVAASSISRAIAVLEAELGIRLFQRTTRQIAPTEGAQRYFERVAPLLREFEQAREEAVELSGTPGGIVRLTASVSFGKLFVVPLIPDFHRRYPKIVLELVLDDANLDLVAERIDLAVRLGPRIEAGNQIIRRLMTTRYRVCASPDYLKRTGRPKSPMELGSRDCILLGLPKFNSLWKFRGSKGQVTEVAVKGNLIVSHPYAAVQAAAAGLGLALLADWISADLVHSGELVDLFPKIQATATDFDTAAWLVYPSRGYIPARVRLLIDFIVERLCGH